MGTVFTAVFVGAAALVASTPSLLSFFTPRSDVAAIKALYEGPNGRAGADKHVVAIERTGEGNCGARFPVYRIYRVTLEGPNGDRQEMSIGVDIQLFGAGNIRQLF